MRAPRESHRPMLGLPVPDPGRDLRARLDAMPPESRRLARTAGGALAAIALVTAFAASAQGRTSAAPDTPGALAWLFALFAAVAVLGVFWVVLALVRGPSRPGDRLPGTAKHR